MGEHRFRNLPAILPGKREVFMADPRLLVIDPEFNCRDMNSAETLAHIDWLADEIEAQGFNPEMPLTVRRRGDDVVIVRGHCRHAACIKLIEKGIELLEIPVMQIASGTSDIDLIFDQEASNYGLRLDPLARARLVLRARRLGVKDEEIARRMHWKSTASVKQHLDLLGTLPEPVKEQVREGDISATEAMKVVKNLPKGTDPIEAAKIIAANREENARIKGKGKSHKVTAKTLKRGKADKIPVPERARRQGELAEQTTKPEPKSESDSADRELGVETSVAKIPTLADVREAERTSYERSRAALAPSALAATSNNNPHPRGIKPLIEAIEPLAKAVADFDSELPDDAVIFISDHGQEINAGQCRMAWKAWNAATGGSSEAEAA